MDWTGLPYEECLQGDEVAMLQFALDRVRRQFAWKTGNLTADQLRRPHPTSSMTLAGLVKHLALVEAGAAARAAGRPIGAPWDERSEEQNEAWTWASALEDEPDELYALWYREAERGRRLWAELSRDGGLDATIDEGDPDWVTSRRRLLVDLLEEYLRHTGHADLLREAVDGLRGNDPD
ncbi:hypothetical protein FHX74_003553 [Friedmanniella endophytica]|uniref:Mini-circle protein n=1 Tax=Microlunatus kandeliicorticis TaxID=1759536 RepID=A0A7W3P7F6_9ACTN|nr:DUF664 domain-containing protein [Microlunatus kandeliicorticis]MBA8795912.1 hypothetical protein [Microlunatus kandeliicorticis]